MIPARSSLALIKSYTMAKHLSNKMEEDAFVVLVEAGPGV